MSIGLGQRHEAENQDLGWVFTGLSDLTLAMLAVMMLLVLYLTLLAARLGDGDASMAAVRERQDLLRRQVRSTLGSIGEDADEASNGTVQTFRFVETGGRSRGGFFQMDSARPTARLERILWRVRSVLAGNQRLYERLMVQGHTDTQPTSREYAWQLSTSRAAAVVIFLTDDSQGQGGYVSPDDVLVSAVGYSEYFNGDFHGERKDVPQRKDFSSEEGWQAACRRIDLLLTYRLPDK